MTDKKIIRQINKLKSISPQKDWQNNCRNILLSQINNSGAKQLSSWQSFIISLKCLSNLTYRPIVITASFLLVLVVTSFFSYQWFQASKPNDSLYIARVISERARLNTVLDSTAREKMAALFAMAHAEDISALLADPNFDLVANSDRVNKLNENFNREIALAKERASSWQKRQEQAETPNKEEEEIEPSSPSVSPSEEDDLIFIADNNKDEQGIEFNQSSETEIVNNIEDNVNNVNDDMINNTETASSSDDIIKTDVLKADLAEIAESIKDNQVEETNLEYLLDEAKELFNQAKYEEAKLKIKEAKELIK